MGNNGGPGWINNKRIRILISKLCYGVEIWRPVKVILQKITKNAGQFQQIVEDVLFIWTEAASCGYWRDPTQKFYSTFLKTSKVLPYINNEVKHDDAEQYRINFLSVRRLVMVGGPDDGVIRPWLSTQFGYFNANLEVVQMRDYFLYKNDSFGLKTLDERNGVTFCTVLNVPHQNWHKSKKVYAKCIKPYVL